MAHDVFVSYASGDKPVADAVCATLESHGIRVWMAPRDVLPGMHYGEAIIDAIHECRIMVLVFSSKANLSGHIPKEIERAVSQGATIMPLRIEDVTPAKSLDYFIGSVHWLDALTPPLETHLQRLAANVQTLLSRSGPKTETQGSSTRVPGTGPSLAPAPAPAHAQRPVWPYIVIGGLTAVVLVLGFLTYRSRQAPPSPMPVATVTTMPAARPAAPPPATPDASVDKKKLVAAVSTTPPAASPAHAAAPPKTPSLASATPPAAAPAAPAPPAAPAAAQPAHPAVPVKPVVLQFASDSSVKLQQLIGDEDKERHTPTTTQTLTRFGIEGSEMGNSFEYQGHVYFLFGPSIGRTPGYANTIAKSDTSNPESGVQLDFLTNGGANVAVQPADVTSMAPMDTPVAGISLDGQMYVAISTNFSRGAATSRSVLTKFAPPATFQTVRTISEMPAGKFIRMSMHAQPAPVGGLPPGGPFVFTWGTGKFRESDVYLAATPVSQFESGKGTRYFAGLDASNAPSWSDNESDAFPIVKDGTLGDVSVTWCKELGLWLMTYDRRTTLNGIAFSYSRTPWGPWSEPQVLFNPLRDSGLGKFIHNPMRRVDDGLSGPVLGKRKKEEGEEVRGGAFAPYVVERWTKVQDSTLNLYYLMSTNNPYVVVLMKSRLQIQ
ncbi:MAG TPA: DUF4185 domain-containing protein [Verrucomicrobiae bacterium]|jgi:hypothetical protein|nr:DUF4185 domain-containing protein [Verrucomicrobiae bacterium]